MVLVVSAPGLLQSVSDVVADAFECDALLTIIPYNNTKCLPWITLTLCGVSAVSTLELLTVTTRRDTIFSYFATC